MISPNDVFQINTELAFQQTALKVFKYQYQNNGVYRSYCDLLNIATSDVTHYNDIPFLPIQFFKTHKVISSSLNTEATFTSSGTTGVVTSKHHVADLKIYESSYLKGFETFYGNIEDYVVLALLPSYLEREGSSLIYMVNDLIKRSKNTDSGFYLNNTNALRQKIIELENKGQKTLLIGVSFALLDFIEQESFKLNHTIIMETGGMKGRRKELIREELHHTLKKGFGVDHIHSEYGMTELLSQAYSRGDGLFNCPPWMKILIRDPEDPLSISNTTKSGGINIIDLANYNSCAFIATQDLGKIHSNNSFEILGRFDHSDIRGCNLMVL